MMIKKSSIFGLLFFCAFCVVAKHVEDFAEDIYEEEFGKVIHASVLFRHGDRNPYAPYPFDPFKNFHWAEGLGHLTNAGKKRLYELGKWFRKRYEHLVGLRYSYIESKMDSSDYDRSLMSAGCFLAGFYPPTESEMWNEEDLRWQPIPIHTVPLTQDNMIAMFKMCDTYNYELFGANGAPRYREMFKKHKNFFNYVGASTGIMFNENFIVFGLLKLMEVYDSLNVQNQNNFSLPVWSKPVFPEPMASLAVKIFDIGTYTEKMKLLKAGPFLRSITTDMFKKAYEQYEQTLHFYSGHDSTIATIMITLGIYNFILPPYGASLIFELREKDNEYVVTVLYKNSTETPPLLLEVPECKHMCTLESFLEVTKPFIPEDWDTECQVHPVIPQMPVAPNWSCTPTDTWIFTQGQTIVLGGITGFILFSMLYFSIQRGITHLSTLLIANQKNDLKRS